MKKIMKINKKITAVFLTAFMIISLMLSINAFAKENQIKGSIRPGITLTDSPKIKVGDKGRFEYTINSFGDIKATGKVVFSSENPNVLEVDKDGNWIAKNTGRTIINYILTYSKETENEFYKNGITMIDIAEMGFEVIVLDKNGKEVKIVSVHRVYNPNSGEHFYTLDKAEKDYLVSLGWRYENVGWSSPEKSELPVYRLYNPNAGDHHYTLNAAEKDNLVNLGWNYEGIAFYSDGAKGAAVYRQYNPNAISGAHNFTTNKAENDYLVSLGWHYENIAWYGVK